MKSAWPWTLDLSEMYPRAKTKIFNNNRVIEPIGSSGLERYKDHRPVLNGYIGHRNCNKYFWHRPMASSRSTDWKQVNTTNFYLVLVLLAMLVIFIKSSVRLLPKMGKSLYLSLIKSFLIIE